MRIKAIGRYAKCTAVNIRLQSGIATLGLRVAEQSLNSVTAMRCVRMRNRPMYDGLPCSTFTNERGNSFDLSGSTEYKSAYHSPRLYRFELIYISGGALCPELWPGCSPSRCWR